MTKACIAWLTKWIMWFRIEETTNSSGTQSTTGNPCVEAVELANPLSDNDLQDIIVDVLTWHNGVVVQIPSGRFGSVRLPRIGSC